MRSIIFFIRHCTVRKAGPACQSCDDKFEKSSTAQQVPAQCELDCALSVQHGSFFCCLFCVGGAGAK